MEDSSNLPSTFTTPLFTTLIGSLASLDSGAETMAAAMTMEPERRAIEAGRAHLWKSEGEEVTESQRAVRVHANRTPFRANLRAIPCNSVRFGAGQCGALRVTLQSGTQFFSAALSPLRALPRRSSQPCGSPRPLSGAGICGVVRAWAEWSPCKFACNCAAMSTPSLRFARNIPTAPCRKAPHGVACTQRSRTLR